MYVSDTNTAHRKERSPVQLDSIPYIAPASVETAAGPTPDGSVAPASLISIYGSNLAPALQIGPSNPQFSAFFGPPFPFQSDP